MDVIANNLKLEKEAGLLKEKKKLELLNEFILELSYKQSTFEFLDDGLKNLCEIIGADFGYILNLTDTNTTARKIVSSYNIPYGFFDDLGKLSFSLEHAINQAKNGIVVEKAKETNNSTRKDIANKYGIDSTVEIPIMEKGTAPISGIYLFSTKERNEFKENVTFLETISNIILALFKKQKSYEKYELNLIRAEKLKTLGELAGGIVHDFNNALTTIMGFCQIALSKVADEDIKNYLGIMYRASLDGKSIVDKIQDYNRNRTVKNRNFVDINYIIESSIDMAKPRWKNYYQGLGTKTEIIKDLSSTGQILCNEHEIREAILNIILNGIDAMESGGRLSLKTYDRGDKIYIEIEDNGPGIGEETKERIFEPFFSTKEGKGTGLGLSITQNIIKSHRGEIYLNSTLGVGTKFTIILGRYIKNKDYMEENIIVPNYSSIKALVIDNRQEVANSVAGLLQMMGIRVDIKEDSEDIVNQILPGKYDVIFSSLSMSRINGIELCKSIKVMDPNQKTVLMTGLPEDISAHCKGIVDYILEKPIRLEDLVKALQKLF